MTIDWVPLSRYNKDVHEEFIRNMDQIQNHVPCTAAMVIDGLPGPQQQGKSFGSTLMYLTGDMTEAYLDGRPFVFGGIWNMADNDECAARHQRGGLECYFEPLSTCSMNRPNSGLQTD